jgi:hypothetical protein
MWKQIFCCVKSEFMVLHPNLTLKGVEEQMFSAGDETMVLFYGNCTPHGAADVVAAGVIL